MSFPCRFRNATRYFAFDRRGNEIASNTDRTRRCSQPLAASLSGLADGQIAVDHNQWFGHPIGVTELDVSFMKFLAYSVLLCVTAVIVYFLLVPSVSIGPTHSDRANAKNDAVQISQAMIFYEKEFGLFPPNKSFSAIIGVLSGNNPKKIVFIDLSDTKITLKNGVPSDPWDNDYRFSTDFEVPHVWSIGRDGIDQEGSIGSDDVASWN